MSETMIKELKVKSVIISSNLPVCDFSVNPYVGCAHACKYCYASFMKRFTKHAEVWGTFVDVKLWDAIKNPQKLKGKQIFIGSVTDPYQEAEEKYQRTREFLKQIQGSGALLSIATKSDLILRDLDLIKSFEGARVSFSVNPLDENFRSDMDCAVSIRRRLDAMKTFYQAGVRTTCFISSIFPGITDAEAIIAETRDYCNLVWLENLNLRGEYKSVILSYIAQKRPELFPLYQAIYNKNDKEYWRMLNEKLRDFCASQNLEYVRDDDSMKRPFHAPPVVVNYFFHELVKKSARGKTTGDPFAL